MKKEQGLAAPPVFLPLKPGAIEPTGWLRDVARTAAHGITGHLDERSPVYRDGWKGIDIGAIHAEPGGVGWPLEQCAYWLDGLVRLAYILQDPVLIQKARLRLDPVVDGVLQGGSSFIHWMPSDVLKNTFNNWAHSHMGRALAAYYQATGDPRILKALVRVYRQYPLPAFSPDFIDVNGMVNLDAMLETYAMSGDDMVLRNALSASQDPDLKRVVENWRCSQIPDGHGVIFYENIRVPALLYPWTGDGRWLEATRNAIEWSDRVHRLPFGLVSSEEYHAGIGSTRNAETCNVAAALWTCHWMLRITGEAEYGDRMEQIFFNAGPAPVSRDYQTMCYYQSPNRFHESLPKDEPSYPGRGESSYRFSSTGHAVECCVGNLNRIVPTYIMHQWMATLDGGLAFTLYGPCRVRASVSGGKVPITIDCPTNYPFEETIRMTVSPAREVSFPLYLRQPAWCEKPIVTVNQQRVAASAEGNGFLKVQRSWKAGDTLAVRFPMSVRVLCGRETSYPEIPYFRRPDARRLAQVKDIHNPFGCVFHGPLLFALPIPDETPNHAAPGAPWNYALDLNSQHANAAVEVKRLPMPGHWHWSLDAPVRLSVPAALFDWQPDDLNPLPSQPVARGKKVRIELVPYGCTKFRVSMFPVTQKSKKIQSSSGRRRSTKLR